MKIIAQVTHLNHQHMSFLLALGYETYSPFHTGIYNYLMQETSVGVEKSVMKVNNYVAFSENK